MSTTCSLVSTILKWRTLIWEETPPDRVIRRIKAVDDYLNELPFDANWLIFVITCLLFALLVYVLWKIYVGQRDPFLEDIDEVLGRPGFLEIIRNLDDIGAIRILLLNERLRLQIDRFAEHAG